MTRSQQEILGTLFLLLILIVLLPLALIWSMNILFPLEIEYTFWTWLAALFIVGLVGSASK